MDIVDELKDSYSFLGDPLHRKAWEEIERLREDKAELLEALKDAANELHSLANSYEDFDASDAYDNAQTAIAKATGGE